MGEDSEAADADKGTLELTEARFAANFRVAREEAGMSQGRFADEMTARGWPWHQQTVTKVETGRRMVRLGEAMAAAEILQISLDSLTRPTDDARIAESLNAAIRTMKTAYRTIAEEASKMLQAKRRLRDHPAVAHADPSSGKPVRDAVAEARQVLQLTPEGAVAQGVVMSLDVAARNGPSWSAVATSTVREWLRRQNLDHIVPFRPRTIDDAGEIIDALRRGETVKIDLKDAPRRHAQRILDFIGGAAKVRGGYLTPIGAIGTATTQYYVAPATPDNREWGISEISDAAAEGIPAAAEQHPEAASQGPVS